MDARKQVEALIAQLEGQQAGALKELVSLRASEKQLGKELGRLEGEAHKWEERAMDAVRAGNDELAKQALAEKARALATRTEVAREKLELGELVATQMAAKKDFERKLASLKARRNTVARDVGLARGEVDALDASASLEKMDELAARIDEDALVSDMDSLLDDGRPSQRTLEQKTAALDADAALAALKKKLGK